MHVIGVTGKIGVGKSTVCEIMSRFGAKVIDADQVVEALYAPGKAGAEKIRNFFGEDFLLKNGAVNKEKLRKVVFRDERKLRILEKMIHPLVAHEIQKKIDRERRQGTDIFVIEAMTFAQDGLGRFIDGLVLVTCRENIVWQRLKDRSLDSAELFAMRQRQKAPLKYDWKIENDGDLEALEKKVRSVILDGKVA